MSFDYENRTVETEAAPKVLAYDGPETVGAKRTWCLHCDRTIISVQFKDRPLEWFHTNTRFKVCSNGTTEATPDPDEPPPTDKGGNDT